LDYVHFLHLIGKAQQRICVPLLAGCLMPNHVHLVVRPQIGGDLSRWTHWLFTTHARHYHKKYGTSGRVWQGRYKLFIIQQDHHLLTVMRYVERNALRANLVTRAEDWR
jgi:putative transposase